MAKGHSGLFNNTKGDKIANGTDPTLKKPSHMPRKLLKTEH
jgi:hypothetical protein